MVFLRPLGQLFSVVLKSGFWKSIWQESHFSGRRNLTLRRGEMSLCECRVESGSDWSLVISLELVHNNCGAAVFSRTRAGENDLPVFIFFLSQFEFLFVNLQKKLTTSVQLQS